MPPRVSPRRALPLLAAAALIIPTATATAAPLPAEAGGAAGGPPLDVRVGTYNTCGHGCLPTIEECEDTIGRDCATKLAPWAGERAAAVAGDIAGAGLEVVATQEIGNNPTPTQPGVDVESFRAPLTAALEELGYAEAPADYAGTRHPEHGYPLQSGAGRFTYYNADRFSHRDAAGADLPHGLVWLPDSTEIYGKTMTWNTLRERTTGALFTVTNLHLEYRKGDAADPNGWQRDWDLVRYNDAVRTIDAVTGREDTAGLPAVFLGDMNSDSREPGRSPAAAFADRGYTDAFAAAPPEERTGEEYASFNGGAIPLPEGDDIDYVMVEAGTPVLRWELVPQTTAGSGEPRDLLRSDHNLVNATVRLERVTE